MSLERFLKFLVAAISLAAAFTLAGFHPILPQVAMVAVLVWSLLVFSLPGFWILALPALLPVMNFSPWSGWFTFEEFDLLLLATLAGCWARWACDRVTNPDKISPRSALAVGLILVGLLAWNTVAFLRGLADAGEIVFDWFAGYDNAMNSLRLFKSMFLAALFFPLLRREIRRDPLRAGNLFADGMAGGLALEVIAMLWERIAYVGLLDFSSRYRATGLFWEMHVGGAAIDGYLVLCLPFAIWALFQAPTLNRWLMAALLVLGTGYVCLTTFSRGVYLAALLEIGMLTYFAVSKCGREQMAGGGRMLFRWLGCALGIFSINAVALFLWGYAGLLVFFLAVLSSFLFARPIQVWLALTGWRNKGMAVVVLILLLEVVAVGGGGTFMLGRLSTSERDLGGRFHHWRNAVGLLASPEKLLFGIGLGRSPAQRAEQGHGEEFPGTFVIKSDGSDGFAQIAGPRDGRLAGLFGLSQRLRIRESGGIRMDADLRFSSDVDFYLKVCEKHLLYEIRCVSNVAYLKNNASGWQHVSIPLEGAFQGENSFLPRFSFFTFTVLGAGQKVDVDNVRLTNAKGEQLLLNGDFSLGGAYWFMTGTAYFLPWHVDSLWLETLLEQGLIGLVLLLGALALSVRFRGRSNEFFSPYLQASVLGLLVVGTFGSVLDVPRLAFCFYWVMTFAICQKAYFCFNKKSIDSTD